MTSRSITSSRRLGAGLFVLAFVFAACGSDDAAVDEAPTETASGATDAPPDETTAETTAEAPAPTAGEEPSATTVDTAEAPSGEATGEPFRIGVQNPEGDPNGSFPEFSLSIQAAADYVNAELGGLQGRPIEIVLCKAIITPDDSQRCANELSADGVDLAISTIDFFGNHYAIYKGSDIPVLSITPITIADFTSPGVYAIGAGGGCLGVHTGLMQFATAEIEELEGITVSKVGVPWADTPPGVVCYNDLEAKPLDVINGTEPGDSVRAGERPDLTHIGVSVLPAAPDVTPQASEVLDFEPDVIVYSNQGADCWNMVNALGRLGWTPDQIPMVLAGACIDFTAMKAAGDLAKGIYFTGTENGLLSPLEGLEGQHLEDATTYQTKGLEYGLSEDDLFKGFAAQGFSAIMSLWEIAQTIDGDVTGESISAAYGATDGTQPSFGNSPLNCSGAPKPYVAVCGSSIAVQQWDGEKLVTVVERLSGLDLVAGTALRPGPK